ncbi:hypothetical protein N8686_05245, partial [Akkermansiaceae bacterium]|nr:hypothetical protein [Akkermansiaceae bacterium]
MIFIRQLAAGLAFHIPGVKVVLSKKFYQETGGTTNLDYCLQIWARHLSALKANGWDTEGKKILEIGPG